MTYGSVATYDMRDIDNWHNDETLIWHLGDQLNSSRLALFIGSGISEPILNLTWKKLVEKLLRTVGGRLSGDSLEEEIARFRFGHFGGNDSGYLDAVQEALYSECDSSFERLQNNPTLGALGALVMASLRGSVGGVVTLNFDDILELYLGYHGFVTKSIYDAIHWNNHGDVIVYHPHGFLPSNMSAHRSHDIVLDKNSYARRLGSEGSKWREIILSLLRTHTCLFVGLAGADLTLSTWLAEVKVDHPSIVAGHSFWGVSFSTDNDPGFHGTWRDMGVYCKFLENYEDHLPDFLYSICQKAAEIRG